MYNVTSLSAVCEALLYLSAECVKKKEGKKLLGCHK